MKKFLLRGAIPRFLIVILCFLTFLPHPRANVFFSHNSPIPTAAASAIKPAAQTPNTTPMSASNPKNALQPAAGSYACILMDNTFFYTAADEKSGLFLLPKTYYVRLLEYRTDYCKIEYQSDVGELKRLVGYARTDALTFVDYTPKRPYLYYVFDLRYKMEDTALLDSSFLTEISLSCVYYGDYTVGSECFCYVLRGEEFGYVPKPTTLQYEENSEYADYLASLQPDPEPPEDSSSATEEKSNSPAQIAILVTICLLVPILAALILKPPRRPPYETDD